MSDDFRPRRQQHHARRLSTRRVGEHVGALGRRPRPSAYTVRSMKGSFWRVSTSATGPLLCSTATRHATAVSVGVGRANDGHVGNGAQRRELLDRLVRGPVLAESDRVVRVDVEHVLLHDRRETHGGAHVVREDQERAAVRQNAAVQRHAVHHRRHCVFANTKMHIARGVVVRREVLPRLDRRVVRRRQVGRPADELGERRRRWR